MGAEAGRKNKRKERKKIEEKLNGDEYLGPEEFAKLKGIEYNEESIELWSKEFIEGWAKRQSDNYAQELLGRVRKGKASFEDYKNLAFRYSYGAGVPKSMEKAKVYLKKALDHPDRDIFSMKKSFDREYEDKEDANAVEELRQHVSPGILDAWKIHDRMDNAVDIYEGKNGKRKDIMKAVEIFNSLRHEGHPVASILYWHHMVRAYPSESKLRQDIEEARNKWYDDPIGCMAGTVK